MFKVLLVDDEPMALEAVKLAADWEETGFTLCGECSNGADALLLVRKLRPELVITDIRMPDMDGLEMIRRMTDEVDPLPRFIIISGYSEFEYAKKAMAFGVQHYVLKPVFKDEFTQILLQVRSQLERDTRLKESDSESLEADTGIFFEQLLGSGGGRNASGIPIPEVIPGSCREWLCALLDVEYGGRQSERADKGCSLDELYKELKAAVEDGFLYTAQQANGLYRIIIGCSEGEDPDTMLAAIASTLDETLSGKYLLGVGNPVPSLQDIGISFRQAREALSCRFYQTGGRIVPYRNMKDSDLCCSPDEIGKMEEFAEYFESMDLDGLTRIVGEVFGIFRSRPVAHEIVEMYVIRVVYKSIAIIENLGGIPEKLADGSAMDLFRKGGVSLDELEEKLADYCRSFCAYAQKLRSDGLQTDRKRVEEYILQNYKRSLTIREISGRLYIHPAYLGRQIVKWFGCGFNEYLHRIRMEEAKKLLTGTDLKTHEIATELGYSTYNGFLQQFEKYVMMKPGEYRNQYKI